ncbi:hypothetical protein XGA_2850, partial [Xanthomonas hortorum ATCC 19865]
MRMRPAASGTTHCWGSSGPAFSVQLQHVAAGLGLARSLGEDDWVTHLAGIQWRIDSNATGQVLVPIQLHALLAIHHQRAPNAVFECRAAVHIRQRAFGMGAIELARSVFQIHRFQIGVLVVFQQHRRADLLPA